MKRAHEAPIAIFREVQLRTDYDYCLVHLLDENLEYRKCFIDAKIEGREIVLDNSIFELGHAFNWDKFAGWVEQLQPTWYMLPDVLENSALTIRNAKEFVSYRLPGKKIGVVQGKNVTEMVECYKEIEPLVDKVAISFDYHFFINEDVYGKLPTKFHYYMYGRDALLHYFYTRGLINVNKPHHLLGCGLPQEFTSYSKYEWIDSVDTSNPVVAGLKGIRYGEEGLQDKPSQKLFELINYTPSQEERNNVYYNIGAFRQICGSR